MGLIQVGQAVIKMIISEETFEKSIFIIISHIIINAHDNLPDISWYWGYTQVHQILHITGNSVKEENHQTADKGDLGGPIVSAIEK